MPDETERLARMLAEANGWTRAGMSAKLWDSYRREAGWLLARGVTLAPTPAPTSGEELGAKVRAAYDMIQALNDGKRNWIMSIPARVDYDPDIVIHVALRALEAEVARLTRELEEARETNRKLHRRVQAAEDRCESWTT
jgi:hypothetical protein